MSPRTRKDIDTAAPIALTPTNGTCAHVAQLKPARPSAPGCEDCLRTGAAWVHLRLCMSCGHVGCCDSSKNKHATAHFHATAHPIVRSLEPGEDWGWCYQRRGDAVSARLPTSCGASRCCRGCRPNSWIGCRRGLVLETCRRQRLFAEGDPADAHVRGPRRARWTCCRSAGSSCRPSRSTRAASPGVLPYSRMEHYRGAGDGRRRHTAAAQNPDRSPSCRRIPELGQRWSRSWPIACGRRRGTAAAREDDGARHAGRRSRARAEQSGRGGAARRRIAARAADRAGRWPRLCRDGPRRPSQRSRARAESFDGPGGELDAMARGRCEDAVGAWLDGRGVAEAWGLAPTLVDAGSTCGPEALARRTPAGALPAAMLLDRGAPRRRCAWPATYAAVRPHLRAGRRR